MSELLCAYIETWHPPGYVTRKLMKPTGKWKLESGPYFKNKMFIEHQGLLFKSWVEESNIVFASAEHTIEFECT